MGCLNSGEGLEHWFGNIHLSGPCNRSCYFCIGQHMMALDGYDTRNTWPLPGIDAFIEECKARDVPEVNVTGTNTDPLLYNRAVALTDYLRDKMPGVTLGIRTNAVDSRRLREQAHLYDKGSVTVCSFDRDIYRAMMGSGSPPSHDDLRHVLVTLRDAKINIVLGPENIGADLLETIDVLSDIGFARINLREPYGQPRVGDPLAASHGQLRVDNTLGMPTYDYGYTLVTYWDVHFVHVESVNLYANGRVSLDYPITRGHAESGEVKSQDNFAGGRVREQWVKLRSKTVALGNEPDGVVG